MPAPGFSCARLEGVGKRPGGVKTHDDQPTPQELEGVARPLPDRPGELEGRSGAHQHALLKMESATEPRGGGMGYLHGENRHRYGGRGGSGVEGRQPSKRRGEPHVGSGPVAAVGQVSGD